MLFAGNEAMKLQPLKKREEFLPADHPIQKVMTMNEDMFPTGGSAVLKVWIYFGVKNLDKSEVNKWDSVALGKVEFDPTFDISQKDSQQYILSLCSDLKYQTFVQQRQVECWINNFTDYVGTYGKTLPLEPAEFNTYLLNFTKTDTGRLMTSDGTLGFKNNKLSYFQIETVSQGKAWGSFNKINPIYLEWKAYLDSF